MTISVMKDCIEHSYDRYLLKESFDKKRARQNFNRLMDLLESGELRVADRDDGSWSVNAWIKKGIILGFYLGNISINEAMTWPQFRDKDTFPLRKIDKYNKFRVIPPAAAIRRGAYVGNGAVIITPAFVNIGAYVDADSVVEGTVGSCAQIGANCHLSAGSVIGGVLAPAESLPVIVGDNVFIGANSSVTQGVIVSDLVTIGSGVFVSRSTPVLDPVNSVVYTAYGTHVMEKRSWDNMVIYKVGELIQAKETAYAPEIPRGAVVIPGFCLSKNGLVKIAPMIVRYITDIRERFYEADESLKREFEEL
jgi:2,3,4,5-tetrahydropyridine-2,6-dicarboxylate N-succinyltransferase